MAFFDRFTQAVNGNGQNSFWGMSEGAKVNNRIAETQNALHQCYQGLGECYYATFRQEEREELRPFVQQITDLLQQMEQLKEEQRSLRGLVACPNCGEDIPKNSVFCPNCGGRAITQDVSRCKNCGAVAPAGAAFCTICGGQMEFIPGTDAAPQSKEQPQEQPQAQPEEQPETQPQKEVCAKCGAPLEAGSQFCTACGASVAEKTAPAFVAEDWPRPVEGPPLPEVEELAWENSALVMPSAPEETHPPVAAVDLEQPVLLPEQKEEQEWDLRMPPQEEQNWDCGMPPREDRRGENLIPPQAWADPVPMQESTPTAHTCPQCGVTLEDDQVFCHNCGCKVAQGDRR